MSRWKPPEHELLEKILHVLERIEKRLPSQYQIKIYQETPMAIGNISAGSTGQLGATLLDNGVAYTLPTGSTYVFTPTFTASDPQVTFEAATTDASGGTIPLDAQTVISVPAGDTGTSVTITATATDPEGNPATGTITIALTPTPQKFTIALSQLA